MDLCSLGPPPGPPSPITKEGGPPPTPRPHPRSPVAVVSVLVVAAQGRQAPLVDGEGEEDLGARVHPHLREKDPEEVAKRWGEPAGSLVCVTTHEERPLCLPSEHPTSTSGSSSSCPGRAADITCVHAVHTSSRAASVNHGLLEPWSILAERGSGGMVDGGNTVQVVR